VQGVLARLPERHGEAVDAQVKAPEWAEEVMTASAKMMPIRPGTVVQCHRRDEVDIGVVVAAALSILACNATAISISSS
jgi:hypothetical protein